MSNITVAITLTRTVHFVFEIGINFDTVGVDSLRERTKLLSNLVVAKKRKRNNTIEITFQAGGLHVKQEIHRMLRCGNKIMIFAFISLSRCIHL